MLVSIVSLKFSSLCSTFAFTWIPYIYLHAYVKGYVTLHGALPWSALCCWHCHSGAHVTFPIRIFRIHAFVHSVQLNTSFHDMHSYMLMSASINNIVGVLHLTTPPHRIRLIGIFQQSIHTILQHTRTTLTMAAAKHPATFRGDQSSFRRDVKQSHACNVQINPRIKILATTSSPASNPAHWPTRIRRPKWPRTNQTHAKGLKTIGLCRVPSYAYDVRYVRPQILDPHLVPGEPPDP